MVALKSTVLLFLWWSVCTSPSSNIPRESTQACYLLSIGSLRILCHVLLAGADTKSLTLYPHINETSLTTTQCFLRSPSIKRLGSYSWFTIAFQQIFEWVLTVNLLIRPDFQTAVGKTVYSTPLPF